MHKLTPAQISKLRTLRRDLHSFPEISGSEEITAKRIETELRNLNADRIWTGVGGHGIAAEFVGKSAGPTVMLRCELDALPITELSDLPYKSQIDGKGHLCGHDGHMASLIGVAMGACDTANFRARHFAVSTIRRNGMRRKGCNGRSCLAANLPRLCIRLPQCARSPAWRNRFQTWPK